MAAKYLLVVLTCVLVGCGVAASDPVDDAKLWQGTWNMVSYKWNGMQPTIDMQWIVEGDQYRIRQSGQMRDDVNTFTLDAANKHVDISYHPAPGAGVSGHAKGIYEIHGDTLKLCYDLSGQDYPTSFAAPARTSRAVFVLQRMAR